MTENPSWNRLEWAKLAVSVFTPLAIFYLGFKVSESTTKQQWEREAAAATQSSADKRASMAREEASRREALARELAARAEARRDAKSARDEAFQRERDLRLEAFVRESRLRDRAERGETTMRREQAEEAHLALIVQKRNEVWTMIAPEANRISHKLADFTWKVENTKPDEVSKAAFELITLDQTMAAYAYYLDPEFHIAWRKFIDSSYRLTSRISEYLYDAAETKLTKENLIKLQLEQEELYEQLLQIAASQLAPIDTRIPEIGRRGKPYERSLP